MTIATQTAGKQWTVASATKPDTLYVVLRNEQGYSCSCLGFYHYGHCKHVTVIAAHEAQPVVSKLSPEAEAWGLAAITGKLA